MTRGKRYALLFGLALCSLYAVPCYADEWEVYVPDDETINQGYTYDSDDMDEEIEIVDYEDEDDEPFEIPIINDLEVASDSNTTVATASNVTRTLARGDISTFASYSSPYDGTISTTILQYFSDVIPKLGNVNYVLFRSGQYTYRLVYADEMVITGTSFTAADAKYIVYDNRYYTWASGTEGVFVLNAGSYLVYSDIGNYPVLARDFISTMTFVLVGAVFLLFILYRSFLAPGRVRI